ncbi:MAG: nucleotidyl transferase AbiEii/AbiGii toxin family protein [Thermoleophilaceae bacterium]
MAEPSRSFRPQKILKLLVEREVDFVVIGGIAGTLHGSARATYDLDITYARDSSNLERLAGVLRDLEARLSGKNVPPDLPFQLDAETLRRGANFTFATRLGRFDICGEPAGAPPYERMRRAAVEMPYDEIRIPVASLDDLIAMKRAAGRVRDKADVAEYIAIGRLARE